VGRSTRSLPSASLPSSIDGIHADGDVQCGIAPNRTFTYDFVIPIEQSGSYWSVFSCYSSPNLDLIHYDTGTTRPRQLSVQMVSTEPSSSTPSPLPSQRLQKSSTTT
jgi:hypothetical protein